MAKIVGVKFKNNGKTYYFAPNGINLSEGDYVIVDTQRGLECGRIIMKESEVADKDIVAPLRPILRKANDSDMAVIKRNEEKRRNAIRTARERVKKHNLDMKILECEYAFDGSKVIIYFSAEGRIDFRDLVKDLAQALRMRIELRQIGIREETKVLGGIGSCGRTCCCAQFLPDFKKVSIKMAKTQGLSLNPTKISGLCGRLMCCLEYENEHYKETLKTMPKINSTVKTPDGEATVVSNNLLKKLVRTKRILADGNIEIKEYKSEQINANSHIGDDIDDSADTEVLPSSDNE